MKKILFIILVLMLVAARGYCQEEMKAPKEFGGVVVGGMFSSAIVQDIDYTTRKIILKNENGEELSVIAGPEVKNFAQINKGDKVNIDFSEKVKITVSEEPSVIGRQDVEDVVSAPLGEKPAGIITEVTQIAAKVEAIDYEGRSLTLQGPEGTMDVEVNDDMDVPNFNEIKVGDMVYIERIERLAISVDAQVK